MGYLDIQNRAKPRFAGIKTFFRLPEWRDKQAGDVIIYGVPFDGASTYRSGSRMAPSRIREISSLGRGFHLTAQRDVFESLKIFDGGDAPVNPLSIKKTYSMLEDFFSKLWRQKKRVLAVGGDHSISLPLLRAAFKEHGPLNLIHFDAHHDSFPPAYGEDFHHGSFIRHAVKEGLLSQVWQLGIRGPLTNAKDRDFIKEHNIHVFSVKDIKETGAKETAQKINPAGPCYLSFDIDCLDPAFAPGTGTPVPGGLSSYEALELLQNLPVKQLVGADLVEVNPAFDSADISSLAGVAVLFECLNLMV